MKTIRWVMASVLVLIATSRARGADSVFVESKSCLPGAQNVIIGVKVFNSQPVCGLVVPLEFRSITQGAFIKSLKLTYGNRLTSSTLAGAIVGVQHGVKSASCGPNYTGFGNVIYDGVGVSHSVGTSPEGAMFVRAKLNDFNLAPGADTTAPSMYLTVDVTDTAGMFEIDTTCMVHSNHLMFAVEGTFAQPVKPQFTKGVIKICNCPHQGDLDQSGFIDVSDVLHAIKVAFVNGVDIHDPTCPRTRADVNNSGAVNVQDVLSLIQTAFVNGPNPINPCQ